MSKVLIMVNDHQHLLEAIETLINRRSMLPIVSFVGSDRNVTKVLIMVNDHQHLLEATLLHYNTDNVNKPYSVCNVTPSFPRKIAK